MANTQLNIYDWITQTRLGKISRWLLMLPVYKQPWLYLRCTLSLKIRNIAVRLGDLVITAGQETDPVVFNVSVEASATEVRVGETVTLTGRTSYTYPQQ